VGAAQATSAVPEVTSPAPAAIAVSPEGASAVSILGADEYLGPTATGIWQSSGGDEARPIASISKLITAMVILEAKPLKNADDPGPTITFSKADHKLYDKYYVLGATIAKMETGSSMSEHDALEAMLVPSASNYAEAVAGWAFGSQSAFIRAANTWLKANGMAHTTMVEPTGIDARNTSTPSDLITLAKLAAADPVIAQISAMPYLDIPDFEQMPNTNDLLGSNGVTGLKTGTLKDSGSDLLFTATLSPGTMAPLTVFGVVLGGYSHSSVNADVNDLLSSIAAGFHDVALAEEGQVVGTYTTPWGESAQMVLGQSASVFTWSDTPITSTIETTTLTTGANGEQVGTVTWTAGPSTETVPVVLAGAITPPTAWWRLTHPAELGK
jgi:D-alanyl-D-alanine carboxypeptidase (penicillin-binding protein 5/6)